MTPLVQPIRRRVFARSLVAALFTGIVVIGGSRTALAADGVLDTTFDTDGKVVASMTSGNDDAIKPAVQPDGKILVAGSTDAGTQPGIVLSRFNADGSLDSTFGADGVVTTVIGASSAVAMDIAVQDDGRVVVAGYSGSPTSVITVVRYTSAGVLDTTFDADGVVTTTVGSSSLANAISIQDDGKIVVAGITESASNSDFAVLRYTATGALDTSFGTGGVTSTPIGTADDEARDLAVQADGKIVVVGVTRSEANNDFAAVRYTATGALDTTFDSDGLVTTPVGSADDVANAVAIQDNGFIVAAGSAVVASTADFAAVRYTATGALDTTFDSDGLVTTPVGSANEEAYGVAVQADGAIVLGGYSRIGSNDGFAVVRLRASGALDATFGSGGTTTTSFGTGLDSYMNGMTLQQDGKIVGVGSTYIDSHWEFSLARYTGPTPAFGITSVYPTSGPVVGGTRITVSGRGFPTVGLVKVSVGGRTCSSVTVISSQRLTCIAPSGRSGAVAVKVTTPSRRSTSRSRAFTYLSRLALPDTYWTQQFGSAADDTPTAIESGPGSDVWVYGVTKGVLDPAVSNPSNKTDLFLARYSKTGTRRWIMQFGSDTSDGAAQRIVVLPNGDALVTGTTDGAMPGSGRDGARTDSDVFLARITKTGALAWVKQWGTVGEEEGWSLATGSSGDVYVMAEVNSLIESNLPTPNAYGGNDDAAVLRFDRNGTFKWARQWGGPGFEYTWDIAVSKGGAIYAAGTTTGDLDGPSGTLCSPTGCVSNGRDDGFLVRLDTSGSIVWARQEGGSGYDEMYGVAVGPTGDVYLGGYTDGTLATPGTNSIPRGARADYDGVVERWSSSGVRLWANQHGTSAEDEGWDLEVAPNGEVFFAGFTQGSFDGYSNAGDLDSYVARISTSGVVTAVHQFSTPVSDANRTWGPVIALSPSNSVTMATSTAGTTWGQLKPGASDTDVAITMFPRPGAASGTSERRWMAQFGSSDVDGTAASGTDAKGNVYVSGVTTGSIEAGRSAPEDGYDLFVSKHDSSGNLLWVRQFGTAGNEFAARQMVVRPNGDVYVTGSTWGSYGSAPKPGGIGNRDVFIAKLNSNGVLQWFKLWGTAGSESATAIASAPNGDLYLALRTTATLPSGSAPVNSPIGGEDSGIAKFDKNGNFRWARQFGSPSSDYALGISVTKQGGIFVGGAAYGSIGSGDGALAPGAVSAGYVARFDKNGNQQWARLYGGAADKSTSITALASASDGSVYAVGFTNAGLSGGNRGELDGVVFRIEASGAPRWVNQHGGSTDDTPMAAVVAKNGWLYTTGVTFGGMAPYAGLGGWDVYVVGVSPDGTSSTVRQYGTESDESYWYETPAIAARPDGRLVLATETTSAAWGGRRSRGGSDIVVTALATPTDTATPPG